MAGSVDATRKYRFGISGEQYQKLLREQNGKCAACGNGEVVLGRGGQVRNLCVDHCHETGRIRGLLCDACNSILGRAEDSPERLRRLAAYLEVADTGLEVRYLRRANQRVMLPLVPVEVDPDALVDEMNNL